MGIHPKHFESRLAPESAIAALATPGVPSKLCLGGGDTGLTNRRSGEGKLNKEKN
jgi:hypothetical protein